MKLNERITDAALKAKLEATIRNDIDLMESDLSDLRVRNFKVVRRRNGATFEGEIVVPRHRFVYSNPYWQARDSFTFHPSGEAVFSVTGEAGVTREQLSALRLLGPVRPVWSSLKWKIPDDVDPMADEAREELMKRDGAKALFDTQFDDFRNSYGMFRTSYFFAGSDVLSVLIQERRYPEAAKAFMGVTGRSLGPEYTRQEFLPKHLAAIRNGLAAQGSPEAIRALVELNAHVTRWRRGDFEPPNDFGP
jgi:hypothetical protein